MKRKIFAIMLSLALVISLLPFTAAAASKYNDVSGHWAERAVTKWSDMGILHGSDGQFRPEAPITRGEMAVIIDQIMKYQTAAPNTFTDLGQAFYTNAILKANAAGVILGSGKTVRPTADITREEAVVMLGRAFGLSGSSVASGFSDKSQISSWAAGLVNTMAARGFIHGYQGAFNPKGIMSRAEIVTILDSAIAGLYSSGQEYTGNLSGIAVVNAPGVILKNMKITGDLIIAEGVGSGEVTLKNVTVTGNTIVRGGGPNSIHIEGSSQISNLIIEKTDDGQIRIVTADGAIVNAVYIDDGNDDIILTGVFKSVIVSAGVSVKAVGAKIDAMKISGNDASLDIDKTSSVGTLTFDMAASVMNNGIITKAVFNAEGVVIGGNKPLEITGEFAVLGEKDTDNGGGGPIPPSPMDLVVAGMTITKNDKGQIVAQFPGVSDYITGLGYKVNTHITVNGTLPAGSLVSVSMNGRPAVTKSLDTLTDLITTDAAMTFSFTEFFGVDPADFTKARYDNTTEIYEITITGNAVAVNTSMTLKTFLFKDGSTVTLENETFALTAAVDPVAAMKAVQEGMTLTGSFGTEIVATFPTIPSVIAGEGYKVNSIITLKDALPDDARVTVIMNDVTVVTDKDLDGTTSFSFTDLFGVNAATFDTDYSGKIETYKIIITGNAAPIDTTMTLKTVISKDNFVTNIVLDEQTFDVKVAKYSDVLMDAVIAGMTLTGSFGTEIVATFPTIPSVIAGEGYKVNSIITLKDALPDEARVTVIMNDVTVVTDKDLDGATSFSFTELFGVNAATFDTDYSGKIETYTIIITGNAAPIDTTMTLKTVISKDNFVTNIVLDEQTFDVKVAGPGGDTTAPSFLADYPKAADIGENSFDILVKANETATYYFVAYLSDDDRDNPSVDQVIEGTDGNDSYSNAWWGKLGPLNADVEGTMSFSHLDGSATYDVFIVAEDVTGNKQATVTKVSVETLTDVSAPVFEETYPKAANIGGNSFDILVKANETVHYYFVGYLSGTTRSEPSVDQVKDGKDGDNSNSNAWTGHLGPMFGAAEGSMGFSGLNGSSTYDVFVVAVDVLGHKQTTVTKVQVTTLADTAAPSFLATYPKASEIGANSFKVLVNADETVRYYVVGYVHDTSRPDPSVDQVIAKTDGNGNGTNTWSGSSGPIPGYYEFYFGFTSGISAATTYDVFVVAVDTANNKTTVKKVTVTTLAE